MRRLPTILLASTLLSAGLTAAWAQSAPATPPAAPPASTTPASQAATPNPDDTVRNDDQKAAETRRQTEAADRSAMFEAHLAALHAGLALTPDQDQLWPPVEQAIRGFATMRKDLRDRRSDMMQDRDDEPGDKDPIATLKLYSDNLLERAQALEALSSAAEPLYAKLSPDQKSRLPVLLRDFTPKRGPIARMVDRLGDEGQDSDRLQHRGWDDRERRDDGGWQGHHRWGGWREGMDDRRWHHDEDRADTMPDEGDGRMMRHHEGPHHGGDMRDDDGGED